MNMRLFAPLLLDIFMKKNDASEMRQAVSQSQEIFRKAIREEILAISFRIIGGLVLASILVYSLIVLGERVNAMLLASADGTCASLATFSTVALATIGTLFFLFRERAKPKAKSESADLPLPGLDLNKVLTGFYKGLNEGIESATERNAERRAQRDERDIQIGARNTYPSPAL